MIPTKEQFLVALKQIEGFSPAPVILSNAMRLMRDPESDIDSIAALVGRDSALVADILRCANSSYYGSSGYRSIGEAVQKIGLRETIRILNLAVARIVSGKDLECYGIAGADYWSESLFNGILMQELARSTGRADPDEAYTVGLLRFIGRLGINQAIQNLQGGLFWDGNESLSVWETQNVGVTQAQAGAILMGNWKFSDKIVQAIGMQDLPSAANEGNWAADALYFATTILPQGVGTPYLPAIGPIVGRSIPRSEVTERFGFDPANLDAVLSATSQEFDNIRKNFGV